MAQVQQFLALRPSSSTNGMFIPIFRPQFNPKFHVFGAISLSNCYRRPTISTPNYVPTSRSSPFAYPHHPTSGFRHFCKFSDSDSMSQLELGKQYGRRKPEKRVNAIFWIILLNLAIYVADHMFLVRDIKALYLFHNQPAWYQFVTAAFCHANWNHLSSNLFFLYIFGKLVEEEEGSFALWLSYILTGAGANLVSWLVLPRNAVSVGASGAVFGLFAISVLVKMSLDWRKILEVLILGQFVIEKVMEAAQASTGLSNGFIGTYSLQNVNHIAHLSGALVGVLLVWLLSRVPSDPSEG
ncbi:rhomboid-like protein 11, chloroplastic [Chenopodium quinoa]|uniref:rhomboid-like protein 11, chloroplastic n=1 Tax=Chenopodium quinoa TaxID=63459 RepID=UPI000B76E6FD|nr:rhomboid-like protein 11, chloroplastic [Chenopodium quinoa]